MASRLPEEAYSVSSSSDIAFLFRWAGISLIGFFLVSTLAFAWPVALLQPGWQLRMARSLLSGSITPLLGACLIRFAQFIDRDSQSLERLLQRIRFLAVWAAIGFVLLIPLQAAAGLRQLRSGEAQVRQRLQQVSKATDAIEKASTAAELRAAILQVPGIEAPRLPPTFQQPLPTVRARLVEALRPRIKQVETRLQNRLQQVWQQWIRDTTRDTLMAGFLAVGFAALGRTGVTKPPLLWSITRFFKRHGMKQMNKQQKASASRVIHKGWIEGLEEEPKSGKSR